MHSTPSAAQASIYLFRTDALEPINSHGYCRGHLAYPTPRAQLHRAVLRGTGKLRSTRARTSAAGCATVQMAASEAALLPHTAHRSGGAQQDTSEVAANKHAALVEAVRPSIDQHHTQHHTRIILAAPIKPLQRAVAAQCAEAPPRRLHAHQALQRGRGPGHSAGRLRQRRNACLGASTKPAVPQKFNTIAGKPVPCAPWGWYAGAGCAMHAAHTCFLLPHNVGGRQTALAPHSRLMHTNALSTTPLPSRYS
jgi:hypothetical protein